MKGIARGAALLALSFGLGFPLFWVVLASLRPESELFGGSVVPGRLGLEHYFALFRERRFWMPLANSFALATATTLITVVFGTSAAYALSRLRFRGRALVLAGLLLVSLFPPIALISPLFVVMRGLGLVGTLYGLVLPYLTFALPLIVWLMAGHFRELPPELEEAALMDGASRLRAFWSVVLPLALPGVAAASILTFVFCWNEFMFAFAFSLEPDRQTVPVALTLLRGRYQVPWGQVLAASVVGALPVVALVLALSRRLERRLGVGR